MLIGEVAERSGISARMLRHYDRIGLVSPTDHTPSGYRRYSTEDVRRLFQVEGLRSLGLSLAEVAEVLGNLSFSPDTMVEQLIARTRESLARQQELLRKLERVRSSDPSAWSDVLRIIGLLHGLDANSPSTRQRLALSLSEEDDGDAAVLAEAMLEESDPNVAGALHSTLAGRGDEAIPILAEALESASPERRQRAAEALAKIDTAAARAVLAEAVRHRDPEVSTRAALVRGRQGHRDAIGALVGLVVDGRYDVDAADVLGALASQHGHVDEVARMIAEALQTADEKARIRLVGALADVPGSAAAETLTALLDDQSRPVALTAASVLHSRKHGNR